MCLWCSSVCPDQVSQSVSGLASLPVSLSYPLCTLSFSSCVCARSSQCVTKCYGSSRASFCAATASRWGAGGRRRCCGQSLCPWKNAARGLRPSASATGKSAVVPDCPSTSLTDSHRRPPWLLGVAPIFGFVPSAVASRDWECVLQPGLRGSCRLPRTVRKA